MKPANLIFAAFFLSLGTSFLAATVMAQDLNVQRLKLIGESRVSDQQLRAMQLSGGVVTSGTFGDVVTGGNFASVVTSGNFANVVTEGNFGTSSAEEARGREALLPSPVIAKRIQDIQIRTLKMLSEKRINVEQFNSIMKLSGGMVTNGNYPNMITSGNYPDMTTNGNYPNMITNGNYPGLLPESSLGALPDGLVPRKLPSPALSE